MKLYKFLIPTIMVIFVGWVIYFFILPTIKSEKVVVIPETIGLTEEEAKNKLDLDNIKYRITYQEGNDDLVLKTVPQAGTIIKENYIIDVYVSKKKLDTVINFCGLNIQEAQTFIDEYQNLGIEVVILEEENMKYDNGLIFWQSINNEQITNVKKIELKVVKNETILILPDFYLKRIDEVYEYTKENGLSIKPVYIDSMLPYGLIIGQEIQAGTKILKNSQTMLTFYVSR